MAGPEAAPDQEAADLLFGLGRAQVALLDRFEMEAGVNHLRRAFDYYAEVGDVDQVAAIGSYPLTAAGARLVHDARLIPRALALVVSQPRNRRYHYEGFRAVMQCPTPDEEFFPMRYTPSKTRLTDY